MNFRTYDTFHNPYYNPDTWFVPNREGGFGKSNAIGIGDSNPYRRDLGYIQGGNNHWTYNNIGPTFNTTYPYNYPDGSQFYPFNDQYSGLNWVLKK